MRKKRIKGRKYGGETKGEQEVQEEGVNIVHWCHCPGGRLKRGYRFGIQVVIDEWETRDQRLSGLLIQRTCSCLGGDDMEGKLAWFGEDIRHRKNWWF